MNPTLPQYEVFAIKYAERDAQRRDNFLFGDPHEGPMPMDYYVWAIRGGGRSFVLDCGFTAEMAAIRKRRIQLLGYLVAMIVWLLGMVGALVWYGTHEGFVGYVFIIPFGFVGIVLWAFGKWAAKVGAKAAPGLPTKPQSPPPG